MWSWWIVLGLCVMAIQCQEAESEIEDDLFGEEYIN
jgi:hypothetical protein